MENGRDGRENGARQKNEARINGQMVPEGHVVYCYRIDRQAVGPYVRNTSNQGCFPPASPSPAADWPLGTYFCRRLQVVCRNNRNAHLIRAKKQQKKEKR